MHNESKFTLEFIDVQLRNLSKIAFEIDDESRAILEIMARNGPVTETRITRLGKRRTILTRDVIRRRLLVKDLSTDFVSVEKGKRIRNLKKREKIFSLTFKGLLASLSEVPLQENFWIKNYLMMIESMNDNMTAKIFLNHIYYLVVAFFILHSNRKGLLTQFKNPEEEFYDNYYAEGSLSVLLLKEQIKGIPDEYKDLFAYCVIQFFVSAEILGTLLINTLQRRHLGAEFENADDVQLFEVIDELYRRWMWSIFLATNRSPLEILDEYEKETEDENEEFNFENILGPEVYDEIRFMAKDELAKINPRAKLSNSLFLD